MVVTIQRGDPEQVTRVVDGEQTEALGGRDEFTERVKGNAGGRGEPRDGMQEQPYHGVDICGLEGPAVLVHGHDEDNLSAEHAHKQRHCCQTPERQREQVHSRRAGEGRRGRCCPASSSAQLTTQATSVIAQKMGL